MRKFLSKLLLFLLLLSCFSILFVRKINLATADIGRHIKNGEVLLTTGKIVSTNFYSYTQPDLKVVNHHWLSGVIFFLVYKAFGFSGLSFFYAILSGLAVYLLYLISKKQVGGDIAFFVVMLLLPLMSYRVEVRPEVFSVLFICIYLYLLFGYIRNEINFKYLLLFIASTQLFWVNLHIFFIVGPFLIALFIFALFITHNVKRAKKLLPVLFLSIAVCFINPFGINGVLEPLTILRTYGYRIYENQPLLFVQGYNPSMIYYYADIIFTLGVVYLGLFIGSARKKLCTEDVIVLTLFVIFGLAAFGMVRMLSLFGFIACLFFASVLEKIPNTLMNVSSAINYLLLASLVSIAIITRSLGWGLYPGVQNGARFFVENNLKGPIFNNYDIGGYLIFNLFPKEKVFVDNRPEAYSVSFLKDTLIKMQQDEEAWKELSPKFNFNVIFFYLNDMTDWAQPFLLRRLDDPQWVPVYGDSFTLVFVKNTPENQSIIQSYKIPRESFRLTKR
ncbi:glycosyltransferase family 39 protein [Patescibacteria group bacterium]|nr:glycosyltransferase family 39 protein [Patescibacteria group bacterium]MBU1952950.1 glycosyltransferase family 39 protein [Patescibacteria group bacterium]